MKSKPLHDPSRQRHLEIVDYWEEIVWDAHRDFSHVRSMSARCSMSTPIGGESSGLSLIAQEVVLVFDAFDSFAGPVGD